MAAIIKIQNLSYEYEDFKLGPIDLEINDDQWISIIGRNGSGKSTLARLIDGLIDAKEGSIYIDNLELNETNIWKIRSKIGMVFQNPDNQFVGANVEDDVAFGLENRQVSYEEMHEIVPEVLKLVGMEQFTKHEPSKLSGGQKQRVAIAGVLAIHPRIVILDEATSMLDPEGKRQLLKLIWKLKQKYHFTVIAITHDIDETVNADRIIVLDKGKILMDGHPCEVYQQQNKLTEIGLDLPFSEKLINLLSPRIDLGKDYLNEEELIEKLWQLNSKI
ncbi:energy-coupling factor transporter ATPase [Ligilactobacillus sp. LYQ135]